MQHRNSTSGGPSLFDVSDLENNNDGPPSPGQDASFIFQKPDLERLGRQRPDVFKTTLSEVFFSASMLVSMLMAVSFSLIPGYRTTGTSEIQNREFLPASPWFVLT